MKCDCAQNPSMHYEENARFKRSKLDMAASAPAPISTGGEGASAGAGLHPLKPTSNGAPLHQLTSSSPSSDMISAAILASRGQPMNLPRIALASVAAFFTYFAVVGLVFGLLPWMRNEFLKYPNIYRPQEGIKSTMPIGMAFMFGHRGSSRALRNAVSGRFRRHRRRTIRRTDWSLRDWLFCGP